MARLCSNHNFICSTIVQSAISSLLFAIFFYFFGKSTIEKYQSGDTHVVTRTSRSPSGLPPPAVTVCPGGDGIPTWRDTSRQPIGLTHYCNSAQFSDIESCVKINTFALDEIINSTSTVKSSQDAAFNSSHYKALNGIWTSSLTLTVSGLCHTYTDENLIERGEFLVFILNGNYDTKIHDHNFFIQQISNHVVPSQSLNSPSSMNYQIIAKQVKRMNRPPTFECNQDTNYSYKSCVKESLAARVGCQSPWDGSNRLEGVKRCNS